MIGLVVRVIGKGLLGDSTVSNLIFILHSSLDTSKIKVMIGENGIASGSSDVQKIQVERVIIHKEYSQYS